MREDDDEKRRLWVTMGALDVWWNGVRQKKEEEGRKGRLTEVWMSDVPWYLMVVHGCGWDGSRETGGGDVEGDKLTGERK